MTNEKSNKRKSILNYNQPITYDVMNEYLNEFMQRYEFFHITKLGRSILGRNIPIISLGKGRKSVMYIGAHHGMEWITTAVLLRFINDYCDLFEGNGKIGNTSVSYLNSTRTIYIVPMLNPDGVEYAINGAREDNPLYDRVVTMNKGTDFSAWQANARGVDLNHNYNAGFFEYAELEATKEYLGGAPTKWCGEEPESEPETSSLANYIRASVDTELFLSLHSQGEEIYYGDKYNSSARNRNIGNILAHLSGYKLMKTSGSASYGGFTDWEVSEIGKPAYTIECGKGKNPLPVSSLFDIYYKLRRLLFEAPMII